MLPQKYVNQQTKMSKNSWKTAQDIFPQTPPRDKILDNLRSTESDAAT